MSTTPSLTISDLLTKQDGEQILSVTGQITQVYPIFHGTGAQGAFTIQDLVFADAQASYKSKFVDRPEVPSSWKGKVVTLESHKGTKGWNGVKMKAKLNKKTQKPELFLWVTPTAVIITDEATAPSQPAAQPRRPAPKSPGDDHYDSPPDEGEANPPAAPPKTAQATRSVTKTTVPGSTEDQQECVKKSKHLLCKKANLFVLSFGAAMMASKAVEQLYGIKFERDDLRRIAMHLSIDMENCDAVDGLPTRDITPFLKKPDSVSH